MQQIWDTFQYQILGMKWLNDVIGNGLMAIGIDTSKRLGGSIQFFLYDTIKILLLLSILIFIISYIQSYFPPERTRKILGRFHGVKANILSALLGTVTPFCSCSSIPLFIGFTNAGLPVGVTFSFLISSPLVDLGALLLLMSIFGAKIAFVYVIVGLVLAVFGGTIIDKLGMETDVIKLNQVGTVGALNEVKLTKKDRMIYAKEQVVATVKKVMVYIVIGVGIGALIHNWIPEAFIQQILGQNNPFSVFIATVVGIPMYADIFGTIPIAEALFTKGVGVGTILALMMGVTALSLPSMIMLRRVIKMRLLVLFVSVVGVGILMIGYFFNAFSFLIV